jgi:hypothetical protein
VAVASDLLQRVPEIISRLTLFLRPAGKIERLMTSDFMMVPAYVSAPWYRNTGAYGKRTQATRRAGQGGDPEEAKAQFQNSWDAWKAWAELRELNKP